MTSESVGRKILSRLLLSILLCSLAQQAWGGSPYTYLWSGFSTSLSGRSLEQKNNAARAGAVLNGTILLPGAILSFNELIGSRDTYKGFVEAPMIDEDGNLKDVPGGGICQLATTVYNAALLAGMKIMERHPHSRAVNYVPPGRDATILSWRKDLKFSNPHNTPLMLNVRLEDDRLTVTFRAVEGKRFAVDILTDSIPIEPESMVVHAEIAGNPKPQQGKIGFKTFTRRKTTVKDVIVEEVVSEDFYPPPSRIISGETP